MLCSPAATGASRLDVSAQGWWSSGMADALATPNDEPTVMVELSPASPPLPLK